jgi:hypothetical protein
MGVSKGERDVTIPSTTGQDAEWTYRPTRLNHVVDAEGRRAVVNGHPDVVAYRRDTPTYGRNGALELLLSVIRNRREAAS